MTSYGKQTILNPPFIKDSGYSWIIHIPEHVNLSDGSHTQKSPLVIYENIKPLGPAHALHQDIRDRGGGMYSHWGAYLYFSTSDNSDPHVNGRTYSISIDATAFDNTERVSGSHMKPVNLRPRDSSPEKVEEDIQHAMTVAENYLKVIPGGASHLKSKAVLELGPGINFGAALILSCFGARVIVSDPYLSPWDHIYHPVFYSGLMETLKMKEWDIDLSPLECILSVNRYPDDLITINTEAAENLRSIPDESIDIIVSAAVVEHLISPQRAFHHLARITRPFGLGFHWVDLRDHRDFSNPLEYLLLSDKEFKDMFDSCHGESGNRYREVELRTFIHESGFSIKKVENYQLADDTYLDEFIPRLRKTANSPYKKYSREELKKISSLFYLVKSAKT